MTTDISLLPRSLFSASAAAPDLGLASASSFRHTPLSEKKKKKKKKKDSSVLEYVTVPPCAAWRWRRRRRWDRRGTRQASRGSAPVRGSRGRYEESIGLGGVMVVQRFHPRSMVEYLQEKTFVGGRASQ
ncbi:hypothetical protein BHM03_00030441 [Ensete ventricosum]|uniref:Uncharacterized protein n=1 Tax=Ensete ventricosum TaxID=4639 RepID=A0A445MIC5_ENSVE|nr:hypothetical protein BHM03_00030441 [Ensete ventricosum]